ncbi:MAG: sulfatase [Akkermansiaceae bacterium]|jgi:arylsulfatase A-like enzyme|nr:sulfatase [Akkermansiaceae bacterium]
MKTTVISISALLLAAFAVNAAEKPNIIFLLADDQSTYSVGCYGNKDVITPEMDRLGADGVIFDRHYDTTAICMASRANIFTGMYEYKTGTNFDHGDMRPDVWAKSYPVLLRESGYLTAFAGKFGIEVDGKGICEEEFDIYAGGPGQTDYATAKNKALAKYAEEFPHSTLAYGAWGQDVIRESVEKEKPFCMSISFKAPHKPATPDPRFKDLYKGVKFTKPANYGREHGEHMSEQSKQGRQWTRFIEWGYADDYDNQMATYYRQVHGIDVALGMIRKELEAQGIADNTVIIYTSDNGFLCGSHGYGSKVLPMEEASRVPLMIYDPRSSTSGKKLRSGRLTGNIDFAPTILELAGLPVPENMDGISIVNQLEDPSSGGHEQLALMSAWGPGPTTALSVVTREHKYTYWWYGDDKMEPTEDLFDLSKDPSELKNLASNPENEPLLKEMRVKYEQELTKWKERAVDYNDYQKYGKLFDRNVSLDEKRALGKAGTRGEGEGKAKKQKKPKSE